MRISDWSSDVCSSDLLSINEIYRWIRSDFYIRDENRPFDYIYSTDIVFDGQPNTQRHTNMIAAFDPTSEIPLLNWSAHFKIVAQANTILSRVESASMTDEQKALFRSEERRVGKECVSTCRFRW